MLQEDRILMSQDLIFLLYGFFYSPAFRRCQEGTYRMRLHRLLLYQPSAHQHHRTVKADQRKPEQHADMDNYLG